MKLVLAAWLVFTALGCRSSSPRVISFNDPGCPVVFSYPAGWRARVSDAKADPDAGCEVLLFASAAEAGGRQNNSEEIQIQMYNESLQEGLSRGGFERDDDGQWVQLAGVSTPRAGEIKTDHASGVQGLVIVRGEGREYPIAVLGNSERSVVISGEGLREESAGAFELVVSTMEMGR